MAQQVDVSDFEDFIKADVDVSDFEDFIRSETEPPEGGFMASAKQAIGATIKGAGRLASDVIPGVDSDNAVAKYGQEVIDANPTVVRGLSDIAENPGKAITEATGNAAGSMAGMVGARAIGMGITAAAPLTGPAAPVVAAAGQLVSWLGPAAIAALPSFGSIRDKQILSDPTNEADAKAKAIAALGAAAVGAIETRFGPQEWALSAMTKEGRSALAEKFVATTLAGRIGKGFAKGAAIEGAEELAQNPIEQAASFSDPTTRESLQETAFGGAMGAIGGGVLGGGAGMVFGQSKSSSRTEEILTAPDVDTAIQAADESLSTPLESIEPAIQTDQEVVDSPLTTPTHPIDNAEPQIVNVAGAPTVFAGRGAESVAKDMAYRSMEEQQAAEESQRRADAFAMAEQQRRDQNAVLADQQRQDQEVEQAQAITQAQGFDTPEPTAMQLAFERARLRKANANPSPDAQVVAQGAEARRDELPGGGLSAQDAAPTGARTVDAAPAVDGQRSAPVVPVGESAQPAIAIAPRQDVAAPDIQDGITPPVQNPAEPIQVPGNVSENWQTVSTTGPAYSKIQAEFYARRMNSQGLPSAVVPHPTEEGKFAIVPADQSGAEPRILNTPISAVNDKTLELAARSTAQASEPARQEIARRSRATPMEDARLKDEDVRAIIQAMPDDAGWAEIGGRLVRHANSEVAGDETITRTKWIPRAEWFTAGMGKPEFIRSAVEKALASQPMRAAEKRTVQAMLDWAHEQAHPQLDQFDTNTLEDAGVLSDTPEERDALDAVLSDLEDDDRPLTAEEEAYFAAEAEKYARTGEFGTPMSPEEVAAWLGEENAQPVGKVGEGAGETVAGQPEESHQPSGEAAQPAKEEGFDLEAQTHQGLEAADQERQAEEARRREQQQAADQKERADREVGSFALTGSDRQADANPNQGDIFSQGAATSGDEVAKAKQILDAAGVTGTDRTNTVAAVRRGDLTAEDVAEAHPQEQSTGPVAAFDAFAERLYSGEATLDEYRAAFADLVNNEQAIRDELAKKTKDKLLAMMGPSGAYRYKNDKKIRIVDGVYDAMVGTFSLNRSVSYTIGGSMRTAYRDAVQRIVNDVNAEELKEFSDRIATRKQENEERAQQVAESIKDPKTLEDFTAYLRAKKNEGLTFKQARMSMTPEQRATYDDLNATQSRGERKARADQQKTDVRVAAQTTEGQIVETKHTRTGEDLFVVKAAERVERDIYNHWNATAKRMGGWYSSYRGNGAVPGFQFKTRENAEAFLKFLGGDVDQAKEAVQARRDAFDDDKSQSAVERLTEMADRLEGRADESLSVERKANTERRARMAANAEAAANSDKALAQTMRNIAVAIEAGNAKFLDRVRQKVQVEYLRSVLATAKYEELKERYPSYGEQEKHRGEPATAETADYAEFPSFTAFRSDLARLGRQLQAIEGTKLLGNRLMKVADDVSDAYLKFAKENFHKVSPFVEKETSRRSGFSTAAAVEAAIDRSGFRGKAIPFKIKNGEYTIVFSPSEAIERQIWQGDNDKRITLTPDFGAELVEKIGKVNRRGNKVSVPWQFETAHDRINMLARMGIETPAEFRAALREFAGLRIAPPEPNKVKELERKMVGRAKDGLDFFPTPAGTAQEMIDAADIKEGMSVLEPSAGMGHIAEQIREAGVDPDVVEMSGDRRELLEAKGFNVVGADFMSLGAENDYQKELDDLVAKREAVRARQMQRLHEGSATRARTTTSNADADKLNERIVWLRDQIKSARVPRYDRIIMNPPFSDRRDVQHVQHAYELLKPGGRLVAIMGEGSFFGQDKKAQEFRDWLESVGGTDEKLAEGTFMDLSLPVNTGVNARMVVIDKPETDKGTALFNRASQSSGTIRQDALDSVIDRVIAASPSHFSRDTVVSTPAFSGLPEPVRAEAQNEGYDENGRKADGQKITGVAYDGKVYLVQGNLSGELEAEETLLHERIHQILHGNAKDPNGTELRQSLNRLYGQMLGRDGIEKLAKAAGVDLSGPLSALPMIKAANRPAFLAEEFLAHAEGRRAYESMPERVQRAIREFWGQFREWLSKTGFVRLAEDLGMRLDDYTQADLAWILKGIRSQEAKTGGKAIRLMSVRGKGQGDTVLRQNDQTDTPAFHKWFGDSVVTDSGKPMSEGGKPLVVYHNTAGDFTEFKTGNELGAHFGTIEQANSFPHVNRSTMPVYLSIKNPLRLEDNGDFAYPTVAAQLEDMGLLKKGMADRYYAAAEDSADVEEMTRNIQRVIENAGYDGIVYLNRREGVDSMGPDGFDGDTISAMSDREFLDEFQEAQDSYIAFHPEQIKSAIGNSGAFDATNPDIRFSRTGQATINQGWDIDPSSPWKDFIYKYQDKYVDLKDAIKAIRETGATISDAFNTYLKEELFHKRVGKRTADFFENEFKPLLLEMQMRGITRDEFEEYLLARHAEEANALIRDRGGMQDGGSGMTDQEAQSYLEALPANKRTAFESLAIKVDKITGKTRQTLVDYGLESQETIDGWARMFQHYVPLNREDMETGQGIGQGFSVRGRFSKHRTGSSRKVADILSNIAQQRDRAIVRGEKNRVAVSLYGLAYSNPNPDIWEAGKIPMVKTVDDNNQIVSYPDRNYKSRDNVIVARIMDKKGNVHDRAVVFNESNDRAMRMAQALKNLDAPHLEGLIGLSAKITRYFASVNTQYNPVFVFINFARDFQGAAFNLSSTPLAGKQKEVMGHAVSAIAGIYSDLRNHRAGKPQTSKWAALYEEMQNEGGTTGYRDMFASASERTEQQIEHLLDPEWWTKTRWGKVLTVNGMLKAPEQILVSGPGKVLFNWLSDANETAENAMRLSVYKTALDHGLTKPQAASLAKNITVNFNRKGQVGAQMNALYAFFNASVQGTARLAETMTGPAGRQIIAGGMLLGVMQTMMMAAAGFDDDQPPEFVKQRNLIIPLGWITGKKDYASIPMPLGLHVLPGIGRLGSELVMRGFKDPGETSMAMLDMLADAFNPIGNAGVSLQTIAPTPLDPLTAIAENKDWTGKPIAKEDFNKMAPTPGHTRAKDTASEFGKRVSEFLNLASGGTKYVAGWMSPTPDQIDYLVGQATGGVGREYMKAEQTITSTVTGEELPTHKIPLLGRMYGTTEGQSSEASKFYDNLRSLNDHEAEIKGRRMDGGDVAGYLRENPEARLVVYANAVERQVSALRRRKSDLIDKGISGDRIRIIEMQISAKMKALNRRVELTEARTR